MNRRNFISAATALCVSTQCYQSANAGVNTLVFGAGGAGRRIVDHYQLATNRPFSSIWIDSKDGAIVSEYRRSESVQSSVNIKPFRSISSVSSACGVEPVQHESKFESFIQFTPELDNFLIGYHHVIVVAGLGGYFGSNSAVPLIDLCLKQDIDVKVVASTPFDFEDDSRKIRSENVLKAIAHRNIRATIVDANEYTMDGQTLAEAITQIDTAIVDVIKDPR